MLMLLMVPASWEHAVHGNCKFHGLLHDACQCLLTQYCNEVTLLQTVQLVLQLAGNSKALQKGVIGRAGDKISRGTF